MTALGRAGAPAFAWPLAGVAPAGGPAAMLPLLAGLALVLVAARIGGALAGRLRLPTVLGELAAGIALGNLGHVGLAPVAALRDLPALETLAQIGVLFLLFQVGLESDLAGLAAVGRSAALVATLGVAAPLALGWLVAAAFLPQAPAAAHAFVGATLVATSVGVTARVLADLGRTDSVEGRVILGAAVLDDVLGLLVLAVVSGVVAAAAAGRAWDATAVLLVAAKALAFLAAAILAGRALARVTFGAAARLGGEGLLLSFALAFCFLLAWLAGLAGLAPIVGAFAAGLVLDESHYRVLAAREGRARRVEELLAPLAAFLVPVFFVLMGMRVDLAAFAAPGVAAFAALLTLAAVLGKQACALGVLERGADRVAVGLGMIPRGEVGLIFAGVGAAMTLAGRPVIGAPVYAAIVAMVAVTTLVTPPLLAWRLARPRG